jgi:hypothetical protein
MNNEKLLAQAKSFISPSSSRMRFSALAYTIQLNMINDVKLGQN